MSGGSYDYTYFKIEDYYVGKTYDAELDEMLNDLVRVLHDLEWWQSGDYSEQDYRDSLCEFKDKWFGKRDESYKRAILQCVNEMQDKINKL